MNTGFSHVFSHLVEVILLTAKYKNSIYKGFRLILSLSHIFNKTGLITTYRVRPNDSILM